MVLWSLGMCFSSNAGFSFPPSLSYWNYSQRLELCCLWITAKIMCSLRKNYPVGVLDVSIPLKQKVWQNLHHTGESKINFLNKKISTRTTPKRKALNYLLTWGLERSFCSQLWIFYESWQNDDDDNSLLSEDFFRRKECKCMYIFNLHMKYKAFCSYLQTHTAVTPHFGAPH